MALTRKEVEALAHLARLNLTPEELERFGGQLEAILGYVERLNGLDLSNMEPTTLSPPSPTVSGRTSRSPGSPPPTWRPTRRTSGPVRSGFRRYLKKVMSDE
jgi:aspartyl-tRNA(Asn)/glutamyl-tRNA(Gln) amidotransferase subunit C